MSEYDNPVWAVIANIVREHRSGFMGSESRIGTRKFHGGAKVFVIGAFWGMGGEAVTVIGRHHGKHYTVCTIRAIYLENFRITLEYNPKAIKLLQAHGSIDLLDGSPESKIKAQDYAETFANNSAYWRRQKLGKWAVQKLEVQDENEG